MNPYELEENGIEYEKRKSVPEDTHYENKEQEAYSDLLAPSNIPQNPGQSNYHYYKTQNLIFNSCVYAHFVEFYAMFS